MRETQRQIVRTPAISPAARTARRDRRGASHSWRLPRRRKLRLLLSIGLIALAASPSRAQGDVPSLETLNARPVPTWLETAQFGIFIRFGLHAVPALAAPSAAAEDYREAVETGAHDGFERHHHQRTYGDNFPYGRFVDAMKAELFDAEAWADLCVRSGARYVVMTAKPPDGYCLWQSEIASRLRGHPWNSVDSGPRRDFLAEFTRAVRARGLRVGLHYALTERGHPLLHADPSAYTDLVTIPEIKELTRRYQPSLLWFEGAGERDAVQWRAQEILTWLYREAEPTNELAVNDGLGKDVSGRLGDVFSREQDGLLGGGFLGAQKPVIMNLGVAPGRGFNRAEKLDAYASSGECIRLLIDAVSRGAHLLLNVGATADGRIPLIFAERLLALGAWLSVNRVAIFGALASPFRETPWGGATIVGETLYLHVVTWPKGDVLDVLGLVTPVKRAWALNAGETHPLETSRHDGVLRVHLSGVARDPYATVIALRLDGDLMIQMPRTTDVARSRAGEVGGQNRWPGGRSWIQQHEDIVALDRQRPDLVFLGDGLFEALGGAGRRVDETARDAWDALYAQRGGANYGVRGDRTQHVLWRLQNGALALARPRVVVVMVGSENLEHDPAEDVAAGIEAVLDSVQQRSPSTRVLLLGLLPRGDTPDDLVRQKAARVNRIVSAIDGGRVTYRDFSATFLLGDGRLDPRYFRPNGKSLTPFGSRTLAVLLRSEIERLMTSPR